MNGQLGNINSDTNTVTYTPNKDYAGEDSFTFTVNDGINNSDEATISILVQSDLLNDNDGGSEDNEEKEDNNDENE